MKLKKGLTKVKDWGVVSNQLIPPKPLKAPISMPPTKKLPHYGGYMNGKKGWGGNK